MDEVTYCMAPGCTNNSSRKTENPVYYHKLSEVKNWHKFCGMKGRAKFKQAVEKEAQYGLCSEHYRPEDYEDHTNWKLKKTAVPTIQVEFNQTNRMCYICLTETPPDHFYAISDEIQSKLEYNGLGFVQKPKIPQKLCQSCHTEVTEIVNYMNRLQKAHNFWQKFGVIMKVIDKSKENPFAKNEEDYPVTADGPEEIWHCKTCGIHFSGKYALYKHIWKYHAINKSDPSVCSQCNKKLSNAITARAHYFSLHYGERSQSSICNICGFLAKNKTHLIYHAKYEHDIRLLKKLSCEWCFVALKDKESFELHMSNIHPEKWKDSNAKTSKNENVNTENNESTVYNDDVMDSLDSTDIKQEPEEKPIGSAVKPNSKRRRYRSKYGDIVLTCPDCKANIKGNPTMARAGLYRHYWMRHGRVVKTPNQCKGCNKMYKTENSCRIHYFDHHFEKGYICDICGKSNMTKAEINVHIKIAHSQKKATFQCRYCDKKFIELTKLSEHEYNHLDDEAKEHSCSVCNKSYPSLTMLKLHLLRHVGKKSYACRYCSKTFFSHGNMRQHERIHIGPAYKCRLCEATFNQMGHVHTHASKHHNITDPEVVKTEMIDRLEYPEIGKRGKRGKGLKKQIEEQYTEARKNEEIIEHEETKEYEDTREYDESREYEPQAYDCRVTYIKKEIP